MQFVKDGPDIPERLLQKHEDDSVVFFCGAGISSPAGLPSFPRLVKRLYSDLGVDPNPVQEATIKASQLDTAVDLLEKEIAGGRQRARNTLCKILEPDLTSPDAITTHQALLTLGKGRDGHTRLITTNFDRLFETAIGKATLPERFRAPLLPVPKIRWNGLVYLHGLLTDQPSPSDLERLVLSSGDFGLAYLTERWAARFVSELLRNFTVCFVGYSINDPVLRYIMDAHAADGVLGESQTEMFAFGSHSKGKETGREKEWKAKNVTPILYREHRHHAFLHRTLRAWAATYRDGARGKERIVVECGMAQPMASTREDDFVGRVLWALSDRTGLPAKRFADLDPVPSLKWLEPLSKAQFGHADLPRFGVVSKATKNDELAFSLTLRPAPYYLAPWMALTNAVVHSSRWDDVMHQLARWLIRHLGDPALLLWLVKHGSQLHEELVERIEDRIENLAKLECGGDVAELDRIHAGAPNAIPSHRMRTLWRIVLTKRVKSRANDLDLDLHRWRTRFLREGLTPALRMELREKLTPRVLLRGPFGQPTDEVFADIFGDPVDEDDNNAESEPQRITDLVGCEIVLSTNHVHSSLQDLSNDDRWAAALPDLLSDFSTLLRDTLDLMRELEGADDRSDQSYVHQPSISEHPQNRKFRDWTVLIDLTRDAWLATAAQSPVRARLAADAWQQIPYPVFRRLRFFAATRNSIIPHRLALDWLLEDEHWWLWSTETSRETIRLLVSLALQLDEEELWTLEQAILAGPPRDMFVADIEPENWARVRDREIWRRLARIGQTGASQGADAARRLAELSSQYTEWQLAEDESDEFSFWMDRGEKRRRSVSTPHRRRDLSQWLKQHPRTNHSQEDDWKQRCRDTFATAACALCELAGEGCWPTDRWREALQAWSEESLIKRSWRYMAPLLAGAPDEVLKQLIHGVSWWLRTISDTFEGQEERFLMLCDRLLALDQPGDDDDDDVVNRAINLPVGHVTWALLRRWDRSTLEDGQGLPSELRPKFTRICDPQAAKLRHGRVLLAAHVIALFRVDRDWATEHLVPLFDWNRSEREARSAWEGFLWSPRLYRPLMEVLKPSFLDTARHFEKIGKHGGQYASLLTFAALELSDVFTNAELATATRSLPQEGLDHAAEALTLALEGAGTRRALYWENRVAPYLNAVWPQSSEYVSPSIAESFGRVCIASHTAFPEALARLRPWFLVLAYPGSIVRQLLEAEVCEKFPEHALDFLHLTIGENSWPPSELHPSLNAIRTAKPALETELKFVRLRTYLQLHGKDLN